MADHFYYRWRVLSEVQGDTLRKWRATPFQVFEDGFLWVPPAATEYDTFLHLSSQWPESATDTLAAGLLGAGKRPLTPQHQEEFEALLASLTRINASIRAGMMFCISRAESSLYITKILIEKILDSSSDIERLLARVYLVSDVLHNTFSTKASAWTYRVTFERHLPDLFAHLSAVKSSLPLAAAEIFDSRVVAILLAWHGWAIYSPELLEGLESTYFKHENAMNSSLVEAAIPPMNDPLLIDEKLDGEAFHDIWLHKQLSLVPWWLRSDLLTWLEAREDINALEKICQASGVLVSSNPYGAGDVLIRRLLWRAEYVLNKRREESKLAALHPQSSAPSRTIPSSPNLAATPRSPIVPGKLDFNTDKVLEVPQTLSIADALANPKPTPKKPAVDPRTISDWLANDLNKLRQHRTPAVVSTTNTAPISVAAVLPEPCVVTEQEAKIPAQPESMNKSPIETVSIIEEDDDMFGLVDNNSKPISAKNVPQKNLEESTQCERDVRLGEIEKQVSDLARSLRGRNIAEQEIQIRCDARRLHYIAKMEDEMLTKD
eukprot:Gregarina_sp_Poly_1__1501@NODE_1378_length_4263_cov_20_659676_g922_i0_p1_GENE_NODE_1378_length_4263_cov_20_659676_g922_i0NODE_1378_length_4263_cov_20_659676_g922_i0_p1_ORF_typecomplete_len547_score65_67CTD_bind/PF04818_13/0_0031_NODE_1378_length_4263_cov_20_659676_g922_i015503190